MEAAGGIAPTFVCVWRGYLLVHIYALPLANMPHFNRPLCGILEVPRC